MTQYKEVWEGKTAQIVEKKSRFIAHIKAVYSVEEAIGFIDSIKKEYWDARHNCYAFRVGVENAVSRFSDDGEPGGTAGKPILEVITGSGIYNIVIVVTRYFGGTLLGCGGLVRAYTSAAQEGIRNSVIIEKTLGRRLNLSMDYTDLGKIQYVLAQNKIITEHTDYADKVTIVAIVRAEEFDRVCKLITEASSARVKIEKGEELYFAQVEDEVVTFE